MWMAIGAVAATADAGDPPRVSMWDVPLLATAKYVARAGRGMEGDYVAYERGAPSCKDAIGGADASTPCGQVHTALDSDDEVLVVVDAKGAVLSTRAAIVAAAQPIDTPAKAVLAVWASPYHFLAPGTYQPQWLDSEVAGTATVRAVKDGFEVAAVRVAHGDCQYKAKDGPSRTVSSWRVALRVDATGKLKETSSMKLPNDTEYCGGMGRRPENFVDARGDGMALESYLQRALHLEAESVRAFERIARELEAHGAPAELIDGAKLAASQERDHAARCAELLGLDAVIARDELPVRGVFELALDNAREGCVVESFGALANAVQARDAATPELRAYFAAIAADELDHAALAHAIANWLDARLSPDERVAVRAAKLDAREQLDHAIAAFDELPGELGIPRTTTARRLLELVPT
jgi:hypothetical protein